MAAGIHLDTTFGHQLCDVLVGQRIPEIPAHAQNDDFSRELAPFERIVRVDRHGLLGTTNCSPSIATRFGICLSTVKLNCWVLPLVVLTGYPAIQMAMDRNHVSGLLKTLSPLQEKVIRLYFGLGCQRSHSASEIAREFHVSSQVISGIIGGAVRSLAHEGLTPSKPQGSCQLTRELTGMSKARNGDAQAIWGLVLPSGAARSAKPGSGDGKIVANSG